MEALFVDEPAVDLRNYLYDLAAAERDKAAGDIVGYIMDQDGDLPVPEGFEAETAGSQDE